MIAACLLCFLLGILATIGYGVHRIKQLAKLPPDELKKIVGEPPSTKVHNNNNAKAQDIRTKIREKTLSTIERLKEVYAISQRQHELQAALDMPSQNALHSRHKNGLVAELRDLEEKKYAILNSILKDGVDPQIRVLNEDGSQVEMKLSEFVARQQGSEPLEEDELPPAAPNAKPAEPKDEIDEELERVGKKVGKFHLYKGGKPDTNH